MQGKKKLILALLVQASAQQFIRFTCSQLVIERLDPLVNPGLEGSPHMHQVVGGNSFNASMDSATHDLVSESTCTSCTFSEDFSNYWTAVMYFKHQNGSYLRVPQYPNAQLGTAGRDASDINGGMTIYYTQKDFSSNGNQYITAFKPVSPRPVQRRPETRVFAPSHFESSS